MCPLASNGLNVELYCPSPADVAVQDQLHVIECCVVLNYCYNLLGGMFHIELSCAGFVHMKLVVHALLFS